MGRTLRRVIAVAARARVIVGSIGVARRAAGAHRRRPRAERGVAYLASQQQPDGSIPAFSPVGSTADAVLAFVAAGVGTNAR